MREKTDMDLYPEILAQLTFFPLGLTLWCITGVNGSNLNLLGFTDLGIVPWILAGCTAIISSYVMRKRKQRYNKFTFEYFHLLILGMLVNTIGAVLLLVGAKDSILLIRLGTYTMSCAIGFTYVPPLMYIHLRTVKNHAFKLAVAHVFYLLGFAVGNTSSSIFPRVLLFAERMSYLVILFSVLLLLGYIVNEILQRVANSYNYKASLDSDFERENNLGDIFKKEYYTVNGEQQLCKAKNLSWVEHNRGKASTLLLLGKLTSIIYFYYPFQVINRQVTVVTNSHPFIAYYFGVIGILFSAILLLRKSCKLGFILSCVVQIVGLLILTVLIISSPNVFSKRIEIMIWVLFACLGFGYAYPNIIILEMSNFENNALILTLGYIFEMLVIGFMYYISGQLLALFNDLRIWPHSIIFIAIIVILCVVAVYVLPSTQHKSILEIKNMIAHSTRRISSPQSPNNTQLQ